MYADNRLALPRLEHRNSVTARLDGVEAKPSRLGHAARRGEEADAEVKVAADPELLGTEGLHAAADILGDPLPGCGVGTQDRVWPTRLVGGDEPHIGQRDQRVPVSTVVNAEADLRDAAGNVNRGGV